MQFDRTAIAISQRTNTELIDLSLVVLRHFWKDLVWYAIFGAIPFAILNWYVTIPLRDYGYLTSFSYGDANAEIGYRILYLLWMAMLVYFEAPLAMSAVTFVLGERAFRIGNDRRKTLSTLWKIKFRLLRVLGMVRGGLLILAVGFFLHGNQSMQRNTSGASGWLLFGLVIIAFVRGFKPFAPEILLLEQTPLKKEPKSAGASKIGRAHV